MRRYADLLATYLRPQRGRVLMLAALLFAGIGLQLLGPQLLSRLIDLARGPNATEAAVTQLAVAFLIVVLLKMALGPLLSYVSAAVAWTATNALREDLALHTLRLDLAYHNAHTPGELIERVEGDPTALSNFFSEFVLRVLGSGLLTLGALVVLTLRDWRIGLALALFTLVTLAVLRRAQSVAIPYFKAIRAALGEFTGFLEERLAGTEDIRANGAVPYVVCQFSALLHGLNKKILRGDVMARVNQSAMEGMIAIGFAITFTVGAILLTSGAITLGLVYLAFDYTNLIGRTLADLSNQLETMQQARVAIDRVDELRNQPDQLRRAQTAAKSLPKDGPLKVVFRNVSFDYAAGVPVLRAVSFELQPGRVLGLLGRTGSGKTTVGRLLSRFYDASSGIVEFDRCDIRAIDLEDVRTRVGVVTQEVQLFNGTVRDNLTFWDERIGDTEIRHALERLGLTAWLRHLPNGLDTTMAVGGAGLSAGEAQLLALARVFLQNPGLVILDEASARLDPGTERLIEAAIDGLLANRTAVVIAHRLSSVMRADDIMVLDGGRVVEHGPREALQRDPSSRFAHLLRTGLIETQAAPEVA